LRLLLSLGLCCPHVTDPIRGVRASHASLIHAARVYALLALMRGLDAARLKVLSLTLFGSSEGRCRPRHVLSTNCNAVAVDLAVDKEHTPALESLKLAVEGGRTTAGVEARPVV